VLLKGKLQIYSLYHLDSISYSLYDIDYMIQPQSVHYRFSPIHNVLRLDDQVQNWFGENEINILFERMIPYITRDHKNIFKTGNIEIRNAIEIIIACDNLSF